MYCVVVTQKDCLCMVTKFDSVYIGKKGKIGVVVTQKNVLFFVNTKVDLCIGNKVGCFL